MPEPPVNTAAGHPEQPIPPEIADALATTVILPAQADGGTRQAADSASPVSASFPSGQESTVSADGSAATATGESPSPGLSRAAGWFGKVPFLGDFASRRLPDAFIKPWDEWLQQSLAATSADLGEGWLDLYLTFPVWRFVMPAGLVGEGCWIGVFLPSVDRVGRCFPLTICEPVAHEALQQAGLIGVDAHLNGLAEVAVAALDATSIAFLEERLETLGPLRDLGRLESGGVPPIGLEAWLRKPMPSGNAAVVGWPLQESIQAMSASAASRFMVGALRERVLWWSPPDDAGGGGAMLLAPYPFPGRLLGNLIGTN